MKKESRKDALYCTGWLYRTQLQEMKESFIIR